MLTLGYFHEWYDLYAEKAGCKGDVVAIGILNTKMV